MSCNGQFKQIKGEGTCCHTATVSSKVQVIFFINDEIMFHGVLSVVSEDEFKSLPAWGAKLLCSVLLRQGTLQDLLQDGSGENSNKVSPAECLTNTSLQPCKHSFSNAAMPVCKARLRRQTMNGKRRNYRLPAYHQQDQSKVKVPPPTVTLL